MDSNGRVIYFNESLAVDFPSCRLKRSVVIIKRTCSSWSHIEDKAALLVASERRHATSVIVAAKSASDRIISLKTLTSDSSGENWMKHGVSHTEISFSLTASLRSLVSWSLPLPAERRRDAESGSWGGTHQECPGAFKVENFPCCYQLLMFSLCYMNI